MKWIKRLFKVVDRYDSDIAELYDEIMKLRERVHAAEDLIRDRTKVGVSVGLDGQNTVIVAGEYKGVDYIETFGLQAGDFNHLVEMLRNFERDVGRVAYIDSPPHLKAVINKKMVE